MAENNNHDNNESDTVDRETLSSSYNPGRKMTITQFEELDKQDESLKKYKETLLGSSGKKKKKKGKKKKKKKKGKETGDDRTVVVEEMTLIAPDRPEGNIMFTDLYKTDKNAKNISFTLKEGCQYRFNVKFHVQNDIVSGLKIINQVFRRNIKVAKDEEMLGSYAPSDEVRSITFPRHDWEEAPSGMAGA
mmetsp:Transcript_14169/g.15693  ORF Transcript_14169/g.15693 Transcript_14169/m.15693 type:complete len:190 (+) Transcript_14169:49-618(+)